jgi:glucan 1,3-beta-glucosidase
VVDVDFSTNVPVAVSDAASESTILAGNTKISSWAQGREYTGANVGNVAQGALTAPTKPAALLNVAGNVFTRSKPQYESLPVSSFLSVKSAGAKGKSFNLSRVDSY